MKTKLICIGVLALAASFGAAAQDTATAGCILVAELQTGRVTYTEFAKRRLELLEAAGQEI